MDQNKNIAADLILASDAVFSGTQSNSHAGFVAISGNKIMATGSIKAMERYKGPKTKLFRFDSELIMPGFHDSHIHLFAGSVADQSISLHQSKSEDEAARTVQSFGKSRPNARWILGYNWNHNNWDKKIYVELYSL